MALNIHTEEDEQRQLRLTVEVPEERVQKAMHDAARTASRSLQIPGFRKGKAPYHIIARYIGESRLRSEAIQDVFPEIFEEALGKLEVEPYGQPSLDNMEDPPLVMTFTIPLAPKIELGDYRSFRKAVEPAEVTGEAIDEALEQVRQKHQVLEPVDRPIERGDVVTLSGKGVVQDEDREQIFDEERIDLVLKPDSIFFGESFIDQIAGMETGDEKQFEITFPDDFGDDQLAGKSAAFNVMILDVKRRELPELDDDLAREEGDYETLEELRDALRQQLEELARETARTELFDEMVDRLVEGAELTYPPAALEAELDDMVESFKRQVTNSGWQWEDYLRLQGESEEDLRQRWTETATTRLQRRLALSAFVEQERLRIGQSDVEANIQGRLERFENEEMKQYLREWLTSESGAQLLANEILIDKIQERFEAIATGNAPDLDALEDEAETLPAGDEVLAEEE